MELAPCLANMKDCIIYRETLAFLNLHPELKQVLDCEVNVINIYKISHLRVF